MSTLVGAPVLDPSLYIPEFKAKRRESVLQDLVERAARGGVVCDPTLLREALALRERAGSTAVGKGGAIPNVRSLGVTDTRVVVGRSSRGIDSSAPDGAPVHLVLLVLSPAETSEEGHLGLLARTAGAVRLQRQRQKLLDAETFEAVAAVLKDVAA